MEPQDYLTDKGKEIFKEILKHIESNGLLYDVDTFQLSQLADAIDLNARACYNINYPTDPKHQDGVQITPNGYTQVTGHITVRDKTQKIIDTLGDKFGLNPAARSKIQAFSKEEIPTFNK